jgi:hypothetical protein
MKKRKQPSHNSIELFKSLIQRAVRQIEPKPEEKARRPKSATWRWESIDDDDEIEITVYARSALPSQRLLTLAEAYGALCCVCSHIEITKRQERRRSRKD